MAATASESADQKIDLAHIYQGVKSTDEGRCDDPYCTGHTSRMIHCSCGWHSASYSDYRTRDSEAKIDWLMHVVQELQSS